MIKFHIKSPTSNTVINMIKPRFKLELYIFGTLIIFAVCEGMEVVNDKPTDFSRED